MNFLSRQRTSAKMIKEPISIYLITPQILVDNSESAHSFACLTTSKAFFQLIQGLHLFDATFYCFLQKVAAVTEIQQTIAVDKLIDHKKNKTYSAIFGVLTTINIQVSRSFPVKLIVYLLSKLYKKIKHVPGKSY